MKSYFLFLLTIACFHLLSAQDTASLLYHKKTYTIPMRDGIKLFTVVYSPVGNTIPLPILMQRTPYGADGGPDTINTKDMGPYYNTMMKDGYILVFQDMRGRFKSEGTFVMNRPLEHITNKAKTDESTDAYDAIDWLVKNIPNNNGKVGILGISYPGYTALQATSDPHPALKASSPQASPADMFLGDDFHHNGAFRLSYGFEYSYFVENEKEGNSIYPFPQFDVFNWYLSLGSPKNVNEKIYHNRIPAWNDFGQHPNYDAFWKTQSMLTQMAHPQTPTLHVGGYYDQEDLNGPQIMYNQLEKKDSFHRNYIILGPWNHGGWAGPKGDSIDKISFESGTALHFDSLQAAWFGYWLKGKGSGQFPEATCFQTGSNVWKSYDTWPPKEATAKRLYTHADGSCSFEKPSGNGTVSYVSDPAKPVPYRALPIEATYGEGSRWYPWQVEDQRFVSTRPDVVSFVADSALQDLTVTGDVKAHLFVSTTGGDADFVVKLIDVYPAFYGKNRLQSGYQFPVTMEVFRGRFRKSFEKPAPFVPGKVEEVVVDLHQINHVFLEGHRMMIQIQSSWFPLIDRNPQKYVPNIYEAADGDYTKATQIIQCNGKWATYVELPVMKE